MQKFFLIFFVFIIFFSAPVFAMTQKEYVEALENRLFGVTYDGQNIDSRIDRIEKQIYDNIYAGTPEERLSKIDKIYPQTDFEYQPQSQQSSYYDNNYEEELPKADYNNYPIISKIEQAIYQKDYSGEDIYKRLSRLETELYGQEKTNLSLQERVESLKSVLPKSARKSAGNRFEFSGFGFGSQGSDGSYYNNDSVISEIEKGTFKKTFEFDDTAKRLNRLEHYYFGQTSEGQSDEDRITRLSSVMMTEKNSNNMMRNAQWAEILMNLLIIGLGFLL